MPFFSRACIDRVCLACGGRETQVVPNSLLPPLVGLVGATVAWRHVVAGWDFVAWSGWHWLLGFAFALASVVGLQVLLRLAEARDSRRCVRCGGEVRPEGVAIQHSAVPMLGEVATTVMVLAIPLALL